MPGTRWLYAVRLVNGDGMQVSPPIESTNRDEVIREIVSRGAWDTSGTLFVAGHAVLTVQPYQEPDEYRSSQDDLDGWAAYREEYG